MHAHLLLLRSRMVHHHLFLSFAFLHKPKPVIQLETSRFSFSRCCYCSPATYNSLLNKCSSLRELKTVHGHIIVNGLSSNLSLVTKLISVSNTVTVGMEYARQVFDVLPHRDVFVWNTVIRGYADSGPCEQALFLYCQMHRNGLQPDYFTFPFVVRSCAVLSALAEGKQAHCSSIKNSFNCDVFVQTSLVAMYSQCGYTHNAQLIFREMESKNMASWTAMIAGYVQNAFYREALGVFHQMLESEVRPNCITLVSILPACANLDQLCQGMLIHSCAVKLGLNSDIPFVNALISMYSKCRNVDIARSLFDRMETRNLVTWNSMIAAYEINDQGKKAINLFARLQNEHVKYDYITMVSVISACSKLGALDTGKQMHELVKRKGFDSNPSITHALLDMYAKCGSVELARKVFDSLGQKSVVSWTAMIGAYAAHGNGKDALLLFAEMQNQGVKPNAFTFAAVLMACSHTGLVEEGKEHFDSMRRYHGIVPGLQHYTSMVDLLGRAGHLIEAYNFIHKMPLQPNADVWVALLGACKVHHSLEMAELVAEQIFQLGQAANCYILMSNIYADAGRWDEVAKLRKLIEKQQMRKVPGQSLVEINQKLCRFFSGPRVCLL